MPDISLCDNGMDNIECGRDDLDLLVGHISYANYSCPHGSGGLITQTMNIRLWLDEIRKVFLLCMLQDYKLNIWNYLKTMLMLLHFCNLFSEILEVSYNGNWKEAQNFVCILASYVCNYHPCFI